jgi:hypothetical protein
VNEWVGNWCGAHPAGKSGNAGCALPGVEASAVTFRVPIIGYATSIFAAPGKPVLAGQDSLVVKTQSEPTALTASIRAALRTIDPALPVSQVQPRDDIIAKSLAPRRCYDVAVVVCGHSRSPRCRRHLRRDVV